MPVGVFPALKLGVLFIKQISKPLAKFLVNQAKSHPIFRTYFIIPPAQFYHWAEVKTKMYVMNLGKPTKVTKLSEAMAIELGASLMGELVIFGIAGGCIILEYNRQVTKETKKEEIRQLQLQRFTDGIQALNDITLQQQTQIHNLQSAILELSEHTKHKLPESLQINSNSNIEDNTKNPDTKGESTTKASIGSESKSLIERAIVYCNKGLRDKLS